MGQVTQATHATSSSSASPAHALDTTTAQLASLLDAELIGPGSIRVTGVAALSDAGPGDLAFIRSERFARRWKSASANAALVSRGLDIPGHDPHTRALLIVPDADHALIRVIEHHTPAPEPPTPGVHQTAIVDPDAEIDPSARIGPWCTIQAGARVGPHASIGPGVHVGERSLIGPGTVIHPRVTVMHGCIIGAGCIIHSGVTIGADGFGYVPREDGMGVVKIPHVGGVVIEDGVEIGANTCVDRGKLGDTLVGAGTKIDNLCQIAHNCRIGRACIICGGVALAGSVTLGDGVVLGGRASAADNITIGAGARLAASSGATADIPPGETWIGIPAAPYDPTWRNYAAFRKLAEMRRELRRLTKAFDRLGQGSP